MRHWGYADKPRRPAGGADTEDAGAEGNGEKMPKENDCEIVRRIESSQSELYMRMIDKHCGYCQQTKGTMHRAVTTMNDAKHRIVILMNNLSSISGQRKKTFNYGVCWGLFIGGIAFALMWTAISYYFKKGQ